jgi:hypothetical protein
MPHNERSGWGLRGCRYDSHRHLDGCRNALMAADVRQQSVRLLLVDRHDTLPLWDRV